jgi:ureidoacrylate peracid hydrolase
MIKPMNLTDKLNPSTTALIVIDMQNDFCSPDGLMGRMGKDVSGMDMLVKGIQSLVEVCENKHIPVFYTQQIYDRTKLTELQKEQYDLDGKMITCDIAGTGWEFYGFDPPENQVYEKYSYNIFSNERLIKDLEKSHIKTLIITGTTSSDPTIQARTLTLVKKTYGTVSNLDELTSILA